jgi:hypothetical protein
VVSAPLAADVTLKSPAALARRVARVVAGGLGKGSSDELAGLGRARTLASSAGTLIHLRPQLRQGRLEVVADVYPVPKSFWDRVRDPRPNPMRHTFSSRAIDAEVRSFFPPVPLVAQKIDRAQSPEPHPLAVACADVNRDGALELVLVGRHRIRVGRIRGAQFRTSTSLAWSELSPVSRSPLRQPLGAIFVGPSHVDIGISDRLDAVRLDSALKLERKLGRRVPWPAGGCSRVVGTRVRPEIEACAPGDPAPAIARMVETDALGGASWVDAQGTRHTAFAAKIFNENKVVVTDASGASATITGLGAQLSLADLDYDGRPELIAGADTLMPAGDALIVYTWQQDGRIVERYRVSVPTGVFAVGVCPAVDGGLRPIALATRGQVWILR